MDNSEVYIKSVPFNSVGKNKFVLDKDEWDKQEKGVELPFGLSLQKIAEVMR